MIFIDWISTPHHENFNKSLFSALGLEHALCYIFHQKLVIDQVACKYINTKSSRIARTLEVVKLCWKHKKEKIVFLTYDPLFLPIILIFNSDIVVYEHNTVPERLNNKHAIWQRLLLSRVKRMAQFKGQVSVLKALKQNVCFVGSPIFPPIKRKKLVKTSCKYYIAPNSYASLSSIKDIIPFLIKNKKIMVKGSSDNLSSIESKRVFTVQHIDLDGDYVNICGVIVVVKSNIRGSGWFNDAITFGLPIITTNRESEVLFLENFPEYPFINLSEKIDENEFNAKLMEIAKFDSHSYVEKCNLNFKECFFQCCYN
jgi:hypothetical protein